MSWRGLALRSKVKSQRNDLEVILDTSFILPTLGIEVEKEIYAALRALRGKKIYYIEEGLLEALWAILRILGKIPISVIERGVEIIRRDYTLLKPSGKAIIEAMKIYDLGHRDYIDALYYTSALYYGIKWLTIDRTFIKFLRKHKYRIEDVIITPVDLIQ